MCFMGLQNILFRVTHKCFCYFTANRVRTEWSREQNAILAHAFNPPQEKKKKKEKKPTGNTGHERKVLHTRAWRAIKFQAWAIYQHEARPKEKIHAQLFNQHKRKLIERNNSRSKSKGLKVFLDCEDCEDCDSSARNNIIMKSSFHKIYSSSAFGRCKTHFAWLED